MLNTERAEFLCERKREDLNIRAKETVWDHKIEKSGDMKREKRA